MADNRTMAQMLQAPIEGYEDAIVVPPINANNFELKQPLINLVQSNKFTDGEARDWLDNENSRSILTWEDIASTSNSGNLPSQTVTNPRQQINTITTRSGKTLEEPSSFSGSTTNSLHPSSSPVKTSDNIEKFTDELAPLDSLPSGNDDSTLKKEFHEDVEIKSSSSSTLTSPEASELEDYLEKDSIPPGIDLTLPTTLEVLSSNPTFPTLTKEKVWICQISQEISQKRTRERMSDQEAKEIKAEAREIMLSLLLNGDLAELICETKIIIWDKAPMITRLTYEPFDRTLRDICTSTYTVNSDEVFGEGKISGKNDGHAEVEFPEEMLIPDSNDHIEYLIRETYNNWQHNLWDATYFQDRVILATIHKQGVKVNERILAKLPGREKVCYSSDSVSDVDIDFNFNESLYTAKFWNTIKMFGIQRHKLVLKTGVPSKSTTAS
ncbi:ATP-dependent DNA helicase PIF1-like protein [Tanacetum coccineum]